MFNSITALLNALFVICGCPSHIEGEHFASAFRWGPSEGGFGRTFSFFFVPTTPLLLALCLPVFPSSPAHLYDSYDTFHQAAPFPQHVVSSTSIWERIRLVCTSPSFFFSSAIPIQTTPG
jgi:hypothetical protein